MKSTVEMNNELDKISTWEEFEEVMKENQIGKKTFGDRLCELCEKYGKKTSAVLEAAAVSRSMYLAVKNDTRNPSKETVIKIAFSLGASLEELNELLKLAKLKELYSKNKDDAIILFGIKNNLDIYEIDEMLRKNNSKMRLLDKE